MKIHEREKSICVDKKILYRLSHPLVKFKQHTLGNGKVFRGFQWITPDLHILFHHFAIIERIASASNLASEDFGNIHMLKAALGLCTSDGDGLRLAVALGAAKIEEHKMALESQL